VRATCPTLSTRHLVLSLRRENAMFHRHLRPPSFPKPTPSSQRGHGAIRRRAKEREDSLKHSRGVFKDGGWHLGLKGLREESTITLG